MNPTPPPTDKVGLREAIEKALIDLYQTAMLHGEAQVNGVLPTQKQRELSIVLAKSEIIAAALAHFKGTRPKPMYYNPVYVPNDELNNKVAEGFNHAIDTWDKDFKEGL